MHRQVAQPVEQVKAIGPAQLYEFKRDISRVVAVRLT
jgi:hypothetical protein